MLMEKVIWRGALKETRVTENQVRTSYAEELFLLSNPKMI